MNQIGVLESENTANGIAIKVLFNDFRDKKKRDEYMKPMLSIDENVESIVISLNEMKENETFKLKLQETYKLNYIPSNIDVKMIHDIHKKR